LNELLAIAPPRVPIMLDTKVGTQKKDDPADVAKNVYEAVGLP
jgi:hypothetical protein